MKQSTVDTKDILNLLKRFRALPSILDAFFNRIGFTGDILNESVFKGEIEEDEEFPFEQLSIQGTTKIPVTIVNNEPLIESTTLRIPGVNVHINNPLLYISDAPDQQRRIERRLRDADSEAADKLLPITHEERLRLTLLGLNRKHQNCGDISILVLGDADENLGAYRGHLSEKTLLDKDGNICRYKYTAKTLTENLPPIYVYTADAPLYTLKMSLKTINSLKYIYTVTIGNKNPLLVHCKNGLNQSAIVAYAFELFRCWEETFSTEYIMPIVDSLVASFNALRRSRSSHALRYKNDVKQAVYLSFGMQLAHMETIAYLAINNFLQAHPEKEFNLHKQKISELIADVTSSDNLVEKISAMAKKVADEPKLTSPYTLGEKLLFWRQPEHFTLLQVFKNVYQARLETEALINEVCRTPREEQERQLAPHKL